MTRFILAFVLTGALSASAGAQCVASWLPGSPSPTLFYSGNIVGQVVGSTMWDPDADGPLTPRWVVGGSMGTIGGVAVDDVAAFDGETWTGFPPIEYAWSLADFGSRLIAGGFYGVKHLNGAAWEDLGDFPGTAWTLHVHNGELYAGGAATFAAVRRWDGDAWQTLADAVFTGLSTRVNALASYEGDLIVGGTFLDVAGLGSRGVARWDGSAWHAMSTGLTVVNALTVHEGAVVAGGNFLVPGSTTRRNVARWEGGAWVPMGDGVPIPVLCFTEHEGELYAAGEGAARTVYRWNGSAWESILTPASNDELSPDAVHLVSFRGELYAAGRASSATGESARHVGVLRWAGDHWRTLHDAPNYHTGGFGTYNNELYCYGSFHTFAGRGARRVARLTSEGWRPVGGGIGTPPGGNPVWISDAVEYNNELVFAGSFTQPGSRLAAWNGTSWRDFEGSAPRLNQSANSLAVYQGQLYAAGEFTRIGIGQGEVVAVGMARWDGDSWNSIPGSSTSVNKLLVYEGRLIIAGNFVSLAGQPFSRIAAWDGKSWSALGGGVDREATALVEFRGDLIVSGSFRNAGGRSASRIARWDGAAWHPLGAGLDQPARELVVHNDRLFAIGTFLTAGGAPARFVAQWDGAAWTPMEGGVGYFNGDQFSGYAPTGGASFDGTLFLAGAFLEAGGRLSPYFARWGVERAGCADFNCSGSTDSQDFFDFLSAFFGALPEADYNADSLINSQDFFDFLASFLGGC